MVNTQQMQMSKLQMLTPTQNEFLPLNHHDSMPNKTSPICTQFSGATPPSTMKQTFPLPLGLNLLALSITNSKFMNH